MDWVLLNIYIKFRFAVCLGIANNSMFMPSLHRESVNHIYMWTHQVNLDLETCFKELELLVVTIGVPFVFTNTDI